MTAPLGIVSEVETAEGQEKTVAEVRARGVRGAFAMQTMIPSAAVSSRTQARFDDLA
jgi:hypothetical protein